MGSKFLYNLGFTRERRIKTKNLSDICEVKRKYFDNDARPMGGGYCWRIILEGKNTSWDIEDVDVYKKVEKGDKLKILYSQSLKETIDYIPPNFEDKKVIKTKISEQFLDFDFNKKSLKDFPETEERFYSPNWVPIGNTFALLAIISALPLLYLWGKKIDKTEQKTQKEIIIDSTKVDTTNYQNAINYFDYTNQ